MWVECRWRTSIAAAKYRDPSDWSTAMMTVPKKGAIYIRLDPEVLAYFRSGGPGYQTRINAVLKTYVEQVSKKPAKV